MKIDFPPDIMDCIAEIQHHLRYAGLRDVRIEITANHLYAQSKTLITSEEEGQ